MRGPPVWIIRLRLTTGLILFGYLVMHFTNHALGLWSLEAMEAGRRWFLALWRYPPVSAVLYLALLTHISLAFWSLYGRRTLRMPAWEAAQLLVGLTIPPLLAYHVVGTRLAHGWYGLNDSYTLVLTTFWMLNPVAGMRQVVLVLMAWTHVCIGLHFWLRLRPWYPRLAPGLLVAAVVFPMLALLGFVQGGREVAERAAEPGWIQRMTTAMRVPGPAEREALARTRGFLIGAYGAALGAVLLARQGRQLSMRRFGAIRITYPGGREVIVPRGHTVLEASRFAGISHASVCGGRGRCSTCRVRVQPSSAPLPSPRPDELRVLARVEAPPDVRLACQLRPTGDVSVAPLLPARAGPAESMIPSRRLEGQERQIAILFADLRGFTSLAEHKLPYDVVFILNRYFETVGRAVKQAGGMVNQFTGDGVMALFGIEAGPVVGSRQALAAAGEIVAALGTLSRELAGELEGPFQVGIGIHAGPTVVGRMGFAESLYTTAVGDSVHVASRLEQLTKEHACRLVISADLAAYAGIELPVDTRREVTLRNRKAPLTIHVIDDVEAVAASLRRPASAP
jgi:adenylate cyclase